MEALQITDSEAAGAICGQDRKGNDMTESLALLPEAPATKRRSWLLALIRLIGVILGAILRGVRAVWAASVRASEAHNRQMEVMDHRYRAYYHFR